MAAALVALRIDADNPDRLMRFWAGVLGREIAHHDTMLLPSDGTGFAIRFRSTEVAKAGPNQMHIHLTSTTVDDQQSTVARVLELGGRHLDVGQRPEEEHVVLADPEGNELCVIEPGNDFLAGCGFLGELACDGSREVGHFWSEALGWPLVWDQDEETAIQSREGGTKIAWGGPPLTRRTTNRFHFEVGPPPGRGLMDTVDHLVSLGARRVDGLGGDADDVVMTDPDGNPFWVLRASELSA